MGQRQTSLSFSVFLLLSAAIVIARADSVNNSSWEKPVWATAKEEERDLPMKLEPEESNILGNETNNNSVESDRNLDFEIDGGFSSLDAMLQWAIGHSDPAKMRETAQDVRHLSATELSMRRMEIMELMEKLKMPSDAQLMQIAITDLNNSSLSLEDHHRALQELLYLVEQIDNANDLNKLGGLTVLIRELDNSDPEIRTTSAWILGKASQNNPVVQKQVLEHGALMKLMKMVKSSSVEEATKSLFAVSALIRNNFEGQELFYSLDGHLMLQDIMSNASIDIRLRKKSVLLVADCTNCQLESTNKAEFPFFSNHFFLKSVVDLTASTDIDLQEKALMAIKSLLQLGTTEALVFNNCGLEGVLERMREQLQELMTEEYLRDFAKDMESLRREVELIFHRKLEKVTSFQNDMNAFY